MAKRREKEKKPNDLSAVRQLEEEGNATPREVHQKSGQQE